MVEIPTIQTAGPLPKAVAVLLKSAHPSDSTPEAAGCLATLVAEAGNGLDLPDIQVSLQRLEEAHALKG